jgi:hypothetical protein
MVVGRRGRGEEEERRKKRRMSRSKDAGEVRSHWCIIGACRLLAGLREGASDLQSSREPLR